MKKYILLSLPFVVIIIILAKLMVDQMEDNRNLISLNDDLSISYDDNRYLNTKYNFETIEVFKKLGENANCIDIGAHKGYFTGKFIEYCPKGSHFAIEPLPHLYDQLVKDFGDEVTIFPHAVSNEMGTATFNYMPDNSGLSGLEDRNKDLRVHEIEVDLEMLDNLIPDSVKIDFIKIDVEGAEFLVMQGAQRILTNDQPVMVFEFGYDSREFFGVTPELIFDFLDGLGYKVSLMEYYLRRKMPFSRDEFNDHFLNGYDFYFIAYPGSSGN